jgi:sensor histidine kinase YesM
MRGKTIQLLIHVIGCMVFLSLPIIFSPDIFKFWNLIHAPHFLQEFTAYLLLLLFFYLNYYVLIPKLYFRKKYIVFALLVIIYYLVVAMLPHSIISDEKIIQSPDFFLSQNIGRFYSSPFRNPFKEHFFEFLVVLTLSLMLKINNRLKLAEKQKVNAELSYLKAQINPHFLFNTLNSIYSLAIGKSDYTATAVLKLSGMMRYVITDVNDKFVSLEKEINYLSDYIELQKIRLDNAIKLDYFVLGDSTGKEIAPLVLISFIENAFKYGVNAEENSNIKIQITITKSYLHLNIFNNKVHVHPIGASKSGLGIKNTKQRLNLLYPGNHKLIIKDTKNDFSVLLSLCLK